MIDRRFLTGAVVALALAFIAIILWPLGEAATAFIR